MVDADLITDSTTETQKKGVILLGKFIITALEEYRNGEREKFDFFINSLQNKGIQHKKRWISALSFVVSVFRQHELQHLLDGLLAINLGKQSSEFVVIYTEFLENLVSSHSKFLPLVLETLVNGFRKYENCNSSSLIVPEIHSSLQRILELIPSCTNTLVQMLASCMPFKDESFDAHNSYIQNLTHVMTYAPSLIDPILEILVEKLLLLDVEVTIDMDEMKEEELQSLEESGPVSNSVNSKEGLESGNIQDDDSESIDTEEAESIYSCVEESKSELLSRIKDMLSKINCIIDILFQFIFSLKDNENEEYLQEFAMSILGIFDRSVLKTHKAKYVSCLLFFVTSLEDHYAETFISILLTRIFSNPSEYIGITAAGYLGSYISRAKNVNMHMVSHTLNLLTEWAHTYLDKVEEEFTNRCFVWYSVMQCILYIFCSHWKTLVKGSAIEKPRKRTRLNSTSSNRGVSFECGEFDEAECDTSDSRRLQDNPLMSWWFLRGGFQRLIYSGLNPLRICQPKISLEFDKIAKELELLFCSSIISTNEQVKATVAVRQESDLVLQEMIQTFFPFDPYFKQLSVKHYIEPLYLTWEEENKKLK